MIRTRWMCLALLLVLALPAISSANLRNRGLLERMNRRLHGVVIDYTNNHGHDHRIWSCALQERRDMYVYLPPGFDPHQRYPLIIYLHGFTQDEQNFLADQVELFDQAIACGKLPPAIIAVPDGSIQGRQSFFRSASFFINSNAGRFEDYLMCDVWNFLMTHYPIRPEREAHALIGASMGGGSAFHLGMKYRDRFKIIVGYMPAVNLRWVDCHCRYRGNFDPSCWGWRTEHRPHEVVGRFYGVLTVRYRHLSNPLFGRGPHVIDAVSQMNSIESIDRFNVLPGELDMFIAYGGRDEFNIDAQVESFLFYAQQRGLCVAVAYDPQGRHNLETGRRLFGPGIEWLAPRLAPFAPCVLTEIPPN